MELYIVNLLFFLFFLSEHVFFQVHISNIWGDEQGEKIKEKNVRVSIQDQIRLKQREREGKGEREMEEEGKVEPAVWAL